jgi:hypothetical protein
MMEVQSEAAPLGVIDSLTTGFNTVAQKPALLLIPLVLDLFLWLGPRLSIHTIVERLSAQIGEMTGPAAENSVALFEQNLTEVLGSYNLFSALSTWPLGVPSLLAGNRLGRGPLGPPILLQVHTWEGLLASLLALVLGGLFLGTLYLSLIARRLRGDPTSLRTWLRQAWIDWLRILVFVLIVLVSAVLSSVPFFLAVEMAALAAAPLGSLLLLVGIGLGMWALFHLFFVAHGVLMGDLGLAEAIRNSILLVSRYRLSSVGLLLVAVLISLGLTSIWSMPASDSWLRLVAIVGNAFVNTGLAVATFVFYRERSIAGESA